MAMMKRGPERSPLRSSAHLKGNGESASDVESCCAVMKECC